MTTSSGLEVELTSNNKSPMLCGGFEPGDLPLGFPGCLYGTWLGWDEVELGLGWHRSLILYIRKIKIYQAN